MGENFKTLNNFETVGIFHFAFCVTDLFDQGLIFQVKGVLGSSRETEPTGYAYIY